MERTVGGNKVTCNLGYGGQSQAVISTNVIYRNWATLAGHVNSTGQRQSNHSNKGVDSLSMSVRSRTLDLQGIPYNAATPAAESYTQVLLGLSKDDFSLDQKP